MTVIFSKTSIKNIRSAVAEEKGGWITHQIILISVPRTVSARLIHVRRPTCRSLHSTSQPIDLMIGLYPRKRFSPRSSPGRLSRRRREILKIVINWMLSGENWPIRIGRSAFPAPKVFIGVIDLPAKRELIGLSVSRSATRRDFIVSSGRTFSPFRPKRWSSCTPSYRILIPSLAEIN